MEDDAPLVQDQHCISGRFPEQLVQLGLMRRVDQLQLFKTTGLTTQLKFCDDAALECAKHHLLFRRKFTRSSIDHAEGAECKPVGADERQAVIEPQMCLTGYKRVGGKTWICCSVRNAEFIVRLENGVCAKRQFTVDLTESHARFRHEPLSLGIEQRD